MSTGFKVRVQQEAEMPVTAGVMLATYRRGAGQFFSQFEDFWKEKNIGKIVSMAQSESDGNITLTIAYLPKS